MQLFSVEKQFFDFKGARLAYRRRPGEYPLVLIHGFTASSEIWNPLVEKLDQRFDLVMVDLYGHGDSQMPILPGHSQDLNSILAFQAAAIADLIRNLGFSSYGLIGSSLGGWVSMELAVNHVKPAGAVLIDTAGVVSLNDAEFRDGLSLLIELYNAQENKLTPVLQKLLDCDDCNSTLMDRSLLKGADFKIAVLWGTEDPVLKVEYGRRFTSELRDSSFLAIKNAGHTPFTTHPDVVASVINGFFTGLL